MKFIFVLLFGLILLVPFSKEHQDRWQVGSGASYPRPLPQEIMVDAVNYIGLLLLHAHSENNENNIAFSPYGAASVLVALAEGVQGTALDEILHATLLPLDVSATRIGFRDIHRHLKSYFIPQEGFLAGLTFSHENVTLKPDYESLLRFYGYDTDSFNNALYPDPYPTSTVRNDGSSSISPTTPSGTETTRSGTNPQTSPSTNTAEESTTPAVSTTSRPTSVTIDVVPSTVGMDVTTSQTDTTENEITYNDDGSFSVNLQPTQPSTERNLLVNLLSTASEKLELSTLATTLQIENSPTSTEGISSKLTELTTNTPVPADESSESSLKTSISADSSKLTELTTITLVSADESSESTLKTSISADSSKESEEADKSTKALEEVETTTGALETTETEKVLSRLSTDDSLALSANGNKLVLTATTLSDLSSTDTSSQPSSESSRTDADTSTATTEEITTSTSIPFTSSIEPRTDDDNNSTIVEDTTTYLDDLLLTKNETVLRSARSVVDFLIARFYDKKYRSKNSDYHRTKRLAFSVNGRYRETNINFMTYETVLPFRYIPYLNSLALTFPLDSTKYYLLLVLPLDELGIDDLVKNIVTVNLKQIVYNLQPTRVKAIIPSFTLKGYVVLTPTMQKLGIQQIFEPRHADFSRMTNEPNIYVTNIEQAVTVTIRNYVDPKSMEDDYSPYRARGPVEFKADHPFLYFVMDSEIHIALMAGKITNPLNSRIR